MATKKLEDVEGDPKESTTLVCYRDHGITLALGRPGPQELIDAMDEESVTVALLRLRLTRTAGTRKSRRAGQRTIEAF